MREGATLWRRTRRKQKRPDRQVLPEEVPRTILAGRRTDEIVRPDRPGPGRGCRGRRLRAAALLRVSASGAIVSATVASRRPTRADPPRQVPHQGEACARVRKRFGATWSPAGEYQLPTLLFAICRRHEIRSQCGVVGPFPRRNGILAKSPFGIDVRHNDRAMERVPVFP